MAQRFYVGANIKMYHHVVIAQVCMNKLQAIEAKQQFYDSRNTNAVRYCRISQFLE